ncbi:CDP-diacylglycerol--serine O-phosphatidyltransferase [Shewanella sp. OPT22]|nr:CDP-diacylglycerol--serine O-phosphatidyltransferase [Shewanella sp. OPT22]
MINKEKALLSQLSGIPISKDSISWLLTPERFRHELLSRIKNAKNNIYLSALYLEDDEAGREIFDALLAAKSNNPKIDIKVFVDFHRARRGLIGQKGDSGNYFMYRSKNAEADHPIDILGTPIKTKEFLGVLHLKGFVIDDAVIFSGSSLNNIYLQVGERYRFDRYHVIESPELAASMRNYMLHELAEDDAVVALGDKDNDKIPSKQQIRNFKVKLSQARYEYSGTKNGTRITPLVGLGRKKNVLNKAVIDLVKESSESLFICTPYFNPPYALSRALIKHLRQGKQVDIVVGDKTANDFFIPDEKDFTTIGAVPYIYEQSLRKFVKRQQWAIDKGLLRIHLWKHETNSFHLKGISADNQNYLITGSNLNPRAWSLDLENGLLIQDPEQVWKEQFSQERTHIIQHTTQLYHYSQIESLKDYPVAVKKILTRIKRLRADFFLRRIL